ncbi:hypothetical protein OAL24_01439 [Oenococcus sicerae]|nr:hypothetical protein OAL24_01439 [Oenococcus sicerae]
MNDSIEDQIPVRRPPLFSRPKKLKSVYIYVEYLIGNAGAAMTWPVTSLYLHNYLHQSFFITGIVLMLGSIVSMIASWLAGFMFDRWRPYESFIISLLIAILGSLMMFFFP